MDSDKKTLAELSTEVKEKKYVTLEGGSKLSGYTVEYLDRLCRLNKIDHRPLLKGGYVVELQSLIRGTHTILVSDAGISFVDQKELAPLPPENIAVTPEVNVSQELPEESLKEIPVWRTIATPPPLPQPSPDRPPPSSDWQAQVLPQQNFDGQVEFVVNGSSTAEASTFSQLPLPPTASPVSTSSSTSDGDEWDAMLFGGDKEATIQSPPASPSPYRPIVTSVDPTPHHDKAPLFPFSLARATGKVSSLESTVAPPPVEKTNIISPPPVPPIGNTPPPSEVASVVQQEHAQPLILPPLRVVPQIPAMVAPRANTTTTTAPPKAIVPAVLSRPKEERHLMIPEPHSLMNGLASSAAIALLVVSSGTIFFSMLFPSVTRDILAEAPTASIVANVANVGMAFPGAAKIFYESKERSSSETTRSTNGR